MAMPRIELETIDRNNALNNIIASIALQEAALSHILNAEGEKIQAAVNNIADITVEQLISINNSVGEVIKGATEIEKTLETKITGIINSIPSIALLNPIAT